jgi:hypothetical protein
VISIKFICTFFKSKHDVGSSYNKFDVSFPNIQTKFVVKEVYSALPVH